MPLGGRGLKCDEQRVNTMGQSQRPINLAVLTNSRYMHVPTT